MTSSNQYGVFKKFTDIEQAKELVELLKQNQIDCKLVDNSPAIDITFANNTLQNEVQLLVNQVDFEAARKVLEQQAEAMIQEVDTSHYLFEFSNEELYEIILKPDEWSEFDFKLSQKILADRGQTVNDDLLNTLKKQRLKDLAEPEQGQLPWIYLGYFSAFFGGIIGLLIGWYLWNFKKTLPNGEKVHAYSEKDQKHGRNIFLFGLICFIVWVVIRMFTYQEFDFLM